MIREITPETTQNIYMTVFATEEESYLVCPEKAENYARNIRTLAIANELDVPRLDALFRKTVDERCIRLFAMPARPWSVPATMFWQSDARFDQYFDAIVTDFKVKHIIFGNGTKHSRRQEDDSDVTVFLERNTR